jgi:PAS domain S-box-containing protein
MTTSVFPPPDSELFRDSFHSSPIGIAVVNLEGKPLVANPALCAMLGFSESEIQNKPVEDFSPPEDGQKDWELFHKLQASEVESYQLEKRYFRRDGSLMWGRLSISMLNRGASPLVLAMVEDISEQKRAQDALAKQTALLQSREELLSVFVRNVPAAVAMLDRDMRYLQVSDRWCADYLHGRADVLGRSHYEIFPDMPERWKQVHRRALQGETLRADEDRWDGQDGTHWARWEVRPWKTAEDVMGGILILAEDISHRKQAEEVLSEMSRKLIEAQEKERARIAREIHDDVLQRLAIVAIELDQLQANPSEIEGRGQELRKQIGEISTDLQTLAHDLHPSKLEFLGAVAGMENWTKEFARRYGLILDFTADVPSRLPPEIGITLFRVLQEALQNIAKHSGAKGVQVRVLEDAGALNLLVRDSGKGFDLEAESLSRGLGITSMRERIRLVNGTIAIHTQPNSGTTIEARVPFEIASS